MRAASGRASLRLRPMRRWLVGVLLFECLCLGACASPRRVLVSHAVYAFDMRQPEVAYSGYGSTKRQCDARRLTMDTIHRLLLKPSVSAVVLTECYSATLELGGPHWAVEDSSLGDGGHVFPSLTLCEAARAEIMQSGKIRPPAGCFPATLSPTAR